MRPVTVNPTPSYKVPDTMTTKTAAIKTGLAKNGVTPVTPPGTYNTRIVLALLKHLTDVNKGAEKWGNLDAVNKKLAAALIKYFTDNKTIRYGKARGSLIDNYGQYCSYCGTPVQDTALAIEHCLPKSEFPSLMLEYPNFFLCCPSCNSNKGSKPTYAMSKEWAKKSHLDPNLDQIMQGGFDRQYWPNSIEAFIGFIPKLYDHTNKTDIPIQYTIQLNNSYINDDQNSVQAVIPNYAGGNMITVAALFSAYNTDIAKEKEDNFMNIIKLNAYTPGDYSDRRVTNRTKTWLKILNSIQLLNLFEAGSDAWKLFLQQVLSTAQSAGFYELWAWLLYVISPPSVGQYSVYGWFVTNTTDPKIPQFYFPGTNLAGLPNK